MGDRFWILFKSAHLTNEVSKEYPRTLIIPVYPYIHSHAHTNFKDLRSHCKKKSSHIKYAAYLKKLFHPPSLSALLSTHFSENAHLLPLWYIKKKTSILVYKLWESFFTISLVLEITSHQQVPFVKKGNENHNLGFYFVSLTSNYSICLGVNHAEKNLLYFKILFKADISATNEVLCANAPGQNAKI